MANLVAMVVPALLMAQHILPDATLDDFCGTLGQEPAGGNHAADLCRRWSSADGKDRASWAGALTTLVRREQAVATPSAVPAETGSAEAPPADIPAPVATALPDTPLGKCLASVPPGSWTDCGTTPIPLVTDGIRGGSGPSSVIRAWNGAAFDPATETMYFTGGGHGDYGGSEIYAFDAPDLAWRLEKPHTGNVIILSTGPGGRCEFRYDDGTPSARHTYDGIEFVDGKIVVAGGSFFCPKSASRGDGSLYTYDLESGTYDYPLGTMEVGDKPRTKSGFDRANRLLMVSNLQTLRTIRDWKILDQRDRLSSGLGVAIFLAGRRHYAIIDDRGLRLFPISRDGRIGTERRVLPASAVAAFQDAGLAELADGNLVIWPGGRSLFLVDTASWTLSRHDPPEGRPGPTDYARVYSKFARLPEHQALMGYNDYQQAVWFFRLDADGTMPDRNRPAP